MKEYILIWQFLTFSKKKNFFYKTCLLYCQFSEQKSTHKHTQLFIYIQGHIERKFLQYTSNKKNICLFILISLSIQHLLTSKNYTIHDSKVYTFSFNTSCQRKKTISNTENYCNEKSRKFQKATKVWLDKISSNNNAL